MYSIALYERGHFCTAIGGPISTLPDAVEQLKITAKVTGSTGPAPSVR